MTTPAPSTPPTAATWKVFAAAIATAFAAVGLTVGVASTATPAPTPTTTVTATVTPSATATATPTPTPTVSVTPSVTPTPSPSPSVTASGFPDATTTGWRHTGVTLTPSGPITVTVAGTVIDSKDITGGVAVKANNVTIRRSRITGGAYYGIRVYAGFTGTTIVDTEVVGVNDPSGLPRCDAGISGGDTILRVDVSNCADLVHPNPGSTISDSYLHAVYRTATTHNDAIQISSGAHYVVRHNTILIGHAENSAVFVKSDFGAIDDVVIDNNYLDGGSYTVFGGDVAPKLVTNVSVTNNTFGLSRLYGLIFTSRMTGPVTDTGNVDTNGAPVF